ncbi:hypothetical protein [Chryseobacterium taklimakanense]|uniref:hypothetical protein n=1 Tax=Chryseobacterium taklimakanense TaxID=536441 RepID=UPI0023F72813|nr:hypothetical protein [Chryseobacterium taklimakanense]
MKLVSSDGDGQSKLGYHRNSLVFSRFPLYFFWTLHAGSYHIDKTWVTKIAINKNILNPADSVDFKIYNKPQITRLPVTS